MLMERSPNVRIVTQFTVLYGDVHFVLGPHGSILKVRDIYLFTARCYAEHSYATVGRPSVRLCL